MYDHIECNYPLPGTTPSWWKPGYKFQTKDTPNQYIDDYMITDDGILVGPNIQGFTGTIEFYSSNQTGGWGKVNYTYDGEDVESASYTATFVDSKLVDIRQGDYSRGPAIKNLDPHATLAAETKKFKEWKKMWEKTNMKGTP